MIELSVAGIVCIVGVLMYALSANPKLAEIGRIMFFCGLFVGLMGVREALRIR
jgi:Na+/phosphate symporter